MSNFLYSTRLPSRSLTALDYWDGENAFLVGTHSLSKPNQLHLLSYKEEDEEAKVQGIFNYQDYPIVNMESRGDLVVIMSFQVPTVSSINAGTAEGRSAGLKHRTLLHRLPTNLSDAGSSSQLEVVCDIEVSSAEQSGTSNSANSGSNIMVGIKEAAFGNGSELLLLDEKSIYVHDLSTNVTRQSLQAPSSSNSTRFTNFTLNPHSDGSEIVTTSDTLIKAFDLKSNKAIFEYSNNNAVFIRDLDFNPNRPYHFVTAGDDCSLYLFDTRNMSSHLHVIEKIHSHWIWSVSFNKFHDQLILSSGSDANVSVYSLPTFSSSASNQKKDSIGDGPLMMLDYHENSVYDSAWAAHDPWLHASLSMDGRVVFGTLGEEKYKVIL